MTYSYTTTIGSMTVRIEAPTAHELRELVEWNEKRQVDEIGRAAVDAVAKEAPSPTPLKWGCRVVRERNGWWTVFAPGGEYLCIDPFSWEVEADTSKGIGNHPSREAALSALAVCTTPPPGWTE